MQKFLVAFSFILAVSSLTFACDCFGYLTHRKEFRKSTSVFVGEVIKIDNPKENVREDLAYELQNELGDLVTLKVLKSWKGSKSKNQVVWTHATYHFCSEWKFEIGKKYLVYVNKVKGIPIGATFCLRTRPLETTNQDKIKEFKDLNSFWFRFQAQIPFL